MAAIANVALSNTFDTWRIRSNQVFTRMNQFAIKESALYANTVTANNNLTAKSGANVNFLGSTIVWSLIKAGQALTASQADTGGRRLFHSPASGARSRRDKLAIIVFQQASLLPIHDHQLPLIKIRGLVQIGQPLNRS